MLGNLKPGDKCLECHQAGLKNQLRLFYINFDEQILKCEARQCLWPHNDEVSSSEDEQSEPNPAENLECDETFWRDLLNADTTSQPVESNDEIFKNEEHTSTEAHTLSSTVDVQQSDWLNVQNADLILELAECDIRAQQSKETQNTIESVTTSQEVQQEADTKSQPVESIDDILKNEEQTQEAQTLQSTVAPSVTLNEVQPSDWPELEHAELTECDTGQIKEAQNITTPLAAEQEVQQMQSMPFSLPDLSFDFDFDLNVLQETTDNIEQIQPDGVTATTSEPLKDFDFLDFLINDSALPPQTTTTLTAYEPTTSQSSAAVPTPPSISAIATKQEDSEPTSAPTTTTTTALQTDVKQTSATIRTHATTSSQTVGVTTSPTKCNKDSIKIQSVVCLPTNAVINKTETVKASKNLSQTKVNVPIARFAQAFQNTPTVRQRSRPNYQALFNSQSKVGLVAKVQQLLKNKKCAQSEHQK